MPEKEKTEIEYPDELKDLSFEDLQEWMRDLLIFGTAVIRVDENGTRRVPPGNVTEDCLETFILKPNRRTGGDGG